MKKYLAMIALVLGLTACASAFNGNEQQITVVTTPDAAQCTLTRKDDGKIGEIDSTPGSAIIKRTSNDVIINCTKKGYKPTVFTDKSDVSAWTFGNDLVLGGVLGNGVDLVTGAAYAYDSPVEIKLDKK